MLKRMVDSPASARAGRPQGDNLEDVRNRIVIVTTERPTKKAAPAYDPGVTPDTKAAQTNVIVLVEEISWKRNLGRVWIIM